MGQGALERKPHLIKWAMVCLNRKIGGLGIRCFSVLNRALLCEWV